MNKQNPVVWFEIYVNDMPRAVKFYETVFQTSFENIPMGDGGEMMAFPYGPDSKNASAWALVKMNDMKAWWNSTIVYFNSTDCAVECSRIAAAGGTVLKEKTSLWEFGNMVLALDTEWNTIGIHSEK